MSEIDDNVEERRVREADWKVFRELRELALERFCERIIGEIRDLSDEDGSYHERYGKIYELIHKCDKQIADGFNDTRRSWMDVHLSQIYRLGLLTPEEVARFSKTTQQLIGAMEKRGSQR